MDLSLDTLCCFHDSTVVHFWHNVTGSSTCAICSSGHYSSAGERSATARKNTRIRYELLFTLVTIEARACPSPRVHSIPQNRPWSSERLFTDSCLGCKSPRQRPASHRGSQSTSVPRTMSGSQSFSAVRSSLLPSLLLCDIRGDIPTELAD